MSSNYGWDANGMEREPYPARDELEPTRVRVIRDWRDAAAAAAESRRPYRRCPVASDDGRVCVYGAGHSIERHSWEVGR